MKIKAIQVGQDACKSNNFLEKKKVFLNWFVRNYLDVKDILLPERYWIYLRINITYTFAENLDMFDFTT